MTYLLDGITFGTVDFSTIWSVVVPMVKTFAPLLVAVIGLQVALMAVQAIAGGLSDARERREDAEQAAIDAELLAMDGVSVESGVMGKFSSWSGPAVPDSFGDTASVDAGGEMPDSLVEDFLSDNDLAVANYYRMQSL